MIFLVCDHIKLAEFSLEGSASHLATAPTEGAGTVHRLPRLIHYYVVWASGVLSRAPHNPPTQWLLPGSVQG
jgi:hypothetical protein